MVSPTTAQLPPPVVPTPATNQSSLWAPQPLPQRCHHHRQFPRLVSFLVHGQSQPCAASAAVQLRNTATPPTNTDPQRPPPAGDLRK